MEDKVLKGQRDTHVNEMPISLILMGIMFVFVAFTGSFAGIYLLICFIGLLLLAAGFVLIKYIGNAKISVDDYRVCGKAQLNKDVDIAISDIETVTLAPLDSVVVKTKTETYRFIGLSTARDFYNRLKS